MNVSDLLSKLDHVRKSGAGYSGRCRLMKTGRRNFL
jgi:hypothetical protein